MKKRILIFIVITFILSGCNILNEKRILGSWYFFTNDADGLSYHEMSFFNDNMYLYDYAGGGIWDRKYKIKGNKLTVYVVKPYDTTLYFNLKFMGDSVYFKSNKENKTLYRSEFQINKRYFEYKNKDEYYILDSILNVSQRLNFKKYFKTEKQK